MKRVLFVDDEQRVLDGLARMLRTLRNEWDMAFAAGAAEGLAMMEVEPFDVVVSDMRMPGMDGAAFLAQVRRCWPGTIRVVLSGHSELEAALRAVPVAHQFLQKPCDSQTIRETVRRILAVREMLTSETLRATIGGLTTLPPQPKVYTKLLTVLSDEEYHTDDVTRLIEADVALAAKIMQLVNSAFFGRPHSVANLRQAVCSLGASLLRNVALAGELGNALARDRRTPPGLLAKQQRQSQLSAAIAHRIMRDTPFAEDAFTAALLHDVGMLIVAGHYPKWLEKAVTAAARDRQPLHRKERELNPITHAEAGAYLLGLWALPMPIVEAVAYHHTPAAVGSTGLDLVAAVHVADCLAQEALPVSRPFPEAPPAALDMDYLASIGVADRVDAWRAHAARIAEAQTEEPTRA